MATPKITGAEYLARTMDACGVTAAFFVPTILSKTLYEMELRTGIRRILTHGEKASVYMADGYARASGRPGICMAQTVGAANLAAGLRDPFLGCSPVLAFTGGPYNWSRGRNYYQEIEDFPLFKPVTKFSGQVTDAGRLPDLLTYAFATATAGKPGPVHLELAGHCGEDVEDGQAGAGILAAAPVSVPRLRTRPAPESVAAAARLLRAASRPVIVAGGGVRASGAGPELRALAERLNAPVATSLNAKDVLPGDHPLNVGVPGLYSRASANHVLLEADLVLFAGSKTGNQVTLKWQVPPLSTKVIQLDIDPDEIGRHYPDTLGILADAKLGLAELADAVIPDAGDSASRNRAAWAGRAQDLVRAWREEWREPMASDRVPIRPERLCAELTAHLPGNALLVSDTGHSGMWTGGMVDLGRPGQGYIRAAGSLGWGLPAALGAQVAQPDRPVVLFTGDGGLWYHIGELETAARCGIPAVIVVNNNSSLNQEINVYTAAYGGALHGRHGELWHFRETDFAAVAESMGALGLTVRKAQDFEGALEAALASGRPAVINVVTEMEALAPRGVTEPAPLCGWPSSGPGSAVSPPRSSYGSGPPPTSSSSSSPAASGGPGFGGLLDGAFDVHVHGQPDLAASLRNRGDDLAVLRLAHAYGIRGWVLKSHLWITTDRAALLQRAAGDLGFTVYGSITLNPPMGGVSAAVVELAAAHGARVVFLPTWGSAADVARAGYVSRLLGQLSPSFPGYEAKNAISLLTPSGALSGECREVIDACRSLDLALATGHASPAESRAVAAYCAQAGQRLLVTHPLHYTRDPGELREFTDRGAFVEFSNAPLIHPDSHLSIRDRPRTPEFPPRNLQSG